MPWPAPPRRDRPESPARGRAQRTATERGCASKRLLAEWFAFGVRRESPLWIFFFCLAKEEKSKAAIHAALQSSLPKSQHRIQYSGRRPQAQILLDSTCYKVLQKDERATSKQ